MANNVVRQGIHCFARRLAVGFIAVCTGCDGAAPGSDTATTEPASATAAGQPIREPASSSSVNPVGATKTPAKGGPPIELDQDVVNLGHVRPGTHVDKTVLITNASDQALTVAAIRTNCGCTKARLSKVTIDAREQVPLQIEFDSDWILGVKDSLIQVEIEGYEPVRLTLSSNISLAVWAEPPSIVSQLPRQDVAVLAGEVTVESVDQRPFRILAVNRGAPAYLDFDPAKDQARSSYRLKWDLADYDATTCKDSAGNPMPPYLAIETDHPECAVFDLPIRHPCTRQPRTREGDAWMIKDQRVLIGGIKPGGSMEFDVVVKWMPKEKERTDVVRAARGETGQFQAELLAVEPIEGGLRCRVRVAPEAGYAGLIMGKVVLQSEKQSSPFTIIGAVR
ncbi:MAG: DUF1573 domain-containing protein [Phycisphaerales bacterium]|nr:DUF1573 domain-containing protein [Phycisphaerales bacterium]MCI0676089.1 DUF1573 domain-containing protein [Phycisphaerales bacterium]